MDAFAGSCADCAYLRSLLVVQIGGITALGRVRQLFRFDGHFSLAPTYPVGRANEINDLMPFCLGSITAYGKNTAYVARSGTIGRHCR